MEFGDLCGNEFGGAEAAFDGPVSLDGVEVEVPLDGEQCIILKAKEENDVLFEKRLVSYATTLKNMLEDCENDDEDQTPIPIPCSSHSISIIRHYLLIWDTLTEEERQAPASCDRLMKVFFSVFLTDSQLIDIMNSANFLGIESMVTQTVSLEIAMRLARALQSRRRKGLKIYKTPHGQALADQFIIK